RRLVLRVVFFDDLFAHVPSSGNALQICTPGSVANGLPDIVANAVWRPIDVICAELVRIAYRNDMQFGVGDQFAHFAETLCPAADVGEVHLVAGRHETWAAHHVTRHDGEC